MTIRPFYEDYLAALRRADRRGALLVARTALAAPIDIRDLYIDIFQAAMYEIGRLWEINEITVAQEHMATAITQSVMAHLYGNVLTGPRLGRRMVATCIGGELHELGLRMVADFFEIEGWDVIFLGANMPVPDLVTLINTRPFDLLAVSASLNAHVPEASRLIGELRASPMGSRIKIIVGGHPFSHNPALAGMIGADMTAPDARAAVRQVQEVLA